MRVENNCGRLIPRPDGGEITYLSQSGRKEIIFGCMFAGKSEEAIRRAKREVYARRNVQVFKPALDDRYGVATINSHNKDAFTAIPVNEKNPEEILMRLNGMTSTVVIDEIQFFGPEIVNVCNELAGQGIRVIMSGLDTDFRGEWFGEMPGLIKESEVVDKIYAICNVCGESADRTQRIVNGKPANYHDPVIMLGAQESYEARCRHCHDVPGKLGAECDE